MSSLFGYGETGPYAGKPAYDDLIQGAVGLPALAAEAGGGEPRYVPLTLSDRIVGIYAVHVVLAALLQRDRTGQGSSVELPMFETMAQMVLGDHLSGRTFDPPLGEPGYARLLTPNRRPYATRDGYVCALIYNDKHWRAFFTAIGRLDEFTANPKLSDHAVRAQHYNEVYGIVADILRAGTTAEWLELFDRCDIPCAPMNRPRRADRRSASGVGRILPDADASDRGPHPLYRHSQPLGREKPQDHPPCAAVGRAQRLDSQRCRHGGGRDRGAVAQRRHHRRRDQERQQSRAVRAHCRQKSNVLASA